MKHHRIIILLATALTLLSAGISASAQPRPEFDWKERMQSEKIAFMTMEIGLTPEEAQKFWPIYNEVNKEQDAAVAEVFKAYMSLEKALSDNKSEKEISKCLQAYMDATEKQNEITSASVEKYKKILSDKKVAKIFVAEEKFRRQNIRRLQMPRPGITN